MVKNIKVVIGANYGDEGKGRVVDFFASNAIKKKKKAIVVCSNGGAQRGHTVVTDSGYQHIFHHFGSGTFAGADTYIPANFIVNPMIFMKEYELLEFCAPVIYINPACYVSTPFDMMNNQIIEQSRGDKRHGSCGVGIWETILRNGATYSEMINMTDDQLFKYLENIRDRYSKNRLYKKNILDLPEEWRKIYYNDEMIHHYIRDFRAMSDRTFGIAKLSNDSILNFYDTIIFENGQGMLLDEEYSKNNLYSTPSKTTLDIPMKIIKDTFDQDNTNYFVEVCYVTRSYLTRHSLGEFREEKPISEMGFICHNFETNINNKNQGDFRYGLFSNTELFNLKTRIYHDFSTNTNDINRRIDCSLAVTHLDEYDIPLDKIIKSKPLSNIITTVYRFYGRKSDDKVLTDWFPEMTLNADLPNDIGFSLSYGKDGSIVIDYTIKE